MIVGELDHIVHASQAEDFAAAARQMGDAVEVINFQNTGHFELVDPTKQTFPVIRTKVMEATAPGWTE